MTQTDQRPDENRGATQAEIERLQHELSREHDLHLRALADFDLKLVTPPTLTDSERALFEQLAAASRFDPRELMKG